jgi:hypothetical protein
MIEKDGNVSKNDTLTSFQGLSIPFGLPNSTYEWMNREPENL